MPMDTTQLKRESRYVLTGVGWLGLGQAVGSLSALVLTLALTRYVDPEVYGAYRYVLSFAAIAGAFGLSGLGMGLMRSIARGADGAFPQALRLGLRHAFIPAGLLALAAAYEYFIGTSAELYAALLIAAAGIVAISCFSLYKYYLTARRAYGTLLPLTLVTEIVPAAVLVAAVLYLPLGLLELIALFFLCYGTVSVLGYVLARRFVPLRDTAHDPSLLTRSRGISFGNIVSALATYGDRLLVFHVLSPVDLARYAVAQILPEQVRALAKLGVSAVFPKLADGVERPLRKIMLRACAGVALIAALVALYIAAVPFMFGYLFPAYPEAAALSQLYAVYSFLGVCFLVPVTMLSVRDDTRAVYHANLALSVLTFLLLPVALYFKSLEAVIWARIVSITLCLPLAFWFVRTGRQPLAQGDSSDT